MYLFTYYFIQQWSYYISHYIFKWFLHSLLIICDNIFIKLWQCSIWQMKKMSKYKVHEVGINIRKYESKRHVIFKIKILNYVYVFVGWHVHMWVQLPAEAMREGNYPQNWRSRQVSGELPNVGAENGVLVLCKSSAHY